MFAVVYKKRVLSKTKTGKTREKWVRGYRAPRLEDDNSADIRARLNDKLPEWEAFDLVPGETIPDGNKTSEPQRYGMSRWRDLFSPRQLLCHGRPASRSSAKCWTLTGWRAGSARFGRRRMGTWL